MKSRYVTNFRVIDEKVAKNPVRTTTNSEGVNIARRRILFFSFREQLAHWQLKIRRVRDPF